MPWRGATGQTCKRCERDVSECGPLSARYRCRECGDGAHLAEVHQMRARSGPWFQHWRRRTAAGVGAVLLDDLADDA